MSKWTSCKAHLPNENKSVLVVQKDGIVSIAHLVKEKITLDELYGLKYDPKNGGKEKETADYLFMDDNDFLISSAVNSPVFAELPDWTSNPVIAWMPLPKPPKKKI